MPLMLPEARERAVLISDVHTELHLDLTSTEDFGVEATISFRCAQPGATSFLELNGGTDVTLDGKPATYGDGRIVLTDLAETNTVRVSARMPYVTDGDGMTVTIDPADDERYVCAHTSMDITQKVIPCFDQPDIKTTFDLSVTAPTHWTVLANGALRDRESSGNSDLWTFETTPPFSSYLFTLVGGPWVSVTWDEPYAAAPGGTLPFGWHARASQERELRRDADELKRITSTCFQHYTTIFEPEYPYADYQQVFAPGLNWGAMEFPGCVVFRDAYLTQGTPTELEKEWVASTIAHEMAHMWFGDLVTMKWWEDSWLNESFADFMGFDVAGIAAGYTDAWTSAAITRKPTGYRADRRRSTHPIAEDTEKIVDVDTAFANFDMITYAKGNATLAQLGHWLGEEDFLAGVNRHLTTHAFGNADLADFLDSLDSATDLDVRSWAQAWLRTTGFDTLVVTRDDSVDGPSVPVLTREGSRPHRLTVSAYDDSMRLVDSRDVHLGAEPVRLEEFAGRVVVPNSGDETFAVIRPDAESWAAITAGLSSVESQLTRALLWWTAVDLCESQVIAVGDLVALADAHLRPETHPLVFEGVMRALQLVARRCSEPDDVAGHLAVIADIARGAVDAADPALAPGASRVLARLSSDPGFLVDWLGRDDVDPSVRWAAVHRLAELGDPSHINAEEARDKSVSGHHAALTARAAIPTAEAKAEMWGRLMGGDLSTHELDAVGAGFWGWEQADLVHPYLTRYVTDGLTLARRSGQAMADSIGDAFPRLPLTPDVRRELRAAVADALATGEVPTVLARAWNDALDDVDRTL